ncbi:MAG: hypothetical protein ACREH8_11960 [Opitutaceae bacterium]
MVRPIALIAASFFLSTPGWGAPAPSLLEQAVERWLGERDHWAFTQRAVEYEDGKPRERLERYDPSRTGNERWTLLAIDGRFPAPDEHAAWARKKFKKNRRGIDTPIGDFFDFHDAKIIAQRDQLVRYEVPLRRDKSWLFQADKVRVVVSVNKDTRALEHLSASVSEPVKVLLGLARITAGKVDLSFLNFDDDAPPGPESAQPTGSARVSVYKFGERVEFTWSDFKRVSPLATASASLGQTTPAFRHP